MIVGWRQQRPVRWRAALAVGVEGRQEERTFKPYALLLVDPAGDEPGMAGFNARLDLHGPDRVRYRSPCSLQAVTFEGAVSMRPLISATAVA